MRNSYKYKTPLMTMSISVSDEFLSYLLPYFSIKTESWKIEWKESVVKMVQEGSEKLISCLCYCKTSES